MRTSRTGLVAAAAVLALGLSACGSDAGDSGTGSSEAGGGLKIGIKFDQPGLGLKKGAEYSGLDVDVATYIAKELGTEAADITWVQAPSAQRETLIESGQVDMVVATYSITDERKGKVSFAGPYFVAGQDLLVRADDKSITGKESLNGKKLCSVTGSTSAQKVKKDVPGVQLQELAGYAECLPALGNGSLDALTTDNAVLAGLAAQAEYAGKFTVVGKPFSEERYGVGLKKGDTATCEKVNTAIAKMISDGAWQKAVDDNLGPAKFTPGPGNPPAQDACS
ncbi:MAG: glutamate ABC transporter substrate-binding protein [Dermatophilaceae bacterium]